MGEANESMGPRDAAETPAPGGAPGNASEGAGARAEAGRIAAELELTTRIRREKRWQREMRIASSWQSVLVTWMLVVMVTVPYVLDNTHWSGSGRDYALILAVIIIIALQSQIGALARLVEQLREDLDALASDRETSGQA